jgi:hypothetical protein
LRWKLGDLLSRVWKNGEADHHNSRISRTE